MEHVSDIQSGNHGGPYLPTPEQIAERTAEIRAGWTEFQRQSRTAERLPVPAGLPEVPRIVFTRRLPDA